MGLRNEPGKPTKNTALFRELGIGAGAAILVFLLFLIPFVNRFELLTLDYRFQHRTTPPPDPAIVLIGIDDASIAKMGRWPWPRSYHGEMVSALQQAGAKVVGFDILFSEPSEDPAEDRAFARALARSKNVIIPFYFAEDGMKTDPSGSLSGSRAVLPVPIIRRAAAGICQVNAPPDRDGITRSLPAVIRADSRLYPTLGLGLALSYLNIHPDNLRLTRGRLEIAEPQGGRILLPTDIRNRMMVNFAADRGKGPGGKQITPFPLYSYATVLTSYFQEKSGGKPVIPLRRFKDKIVLIGSMASALGDLKPTSVNPQLPMFELHANVLNNILENGFLVQPGILTRLVVLLLLGLAAAAAIRREHLIRGIFLSVVLLAVYSLAATVLFRRNIRLDLAAPFSVIFLTCLCVTLDSFRAERKEKDFIRSTFHRYVAPEVIDKLLSEKSAVNLGGDRRKVTVLFADIRGFTALSEDRPPEEVVELLNESLTVIADAIFKYRGTLDKFIGDCVMAVFGAPLRQNDQELTAIKAALEIKEGIAGISAKWSAKLGTNVGVGVGINTGEAVIGNIGSAKRMDYTAIGDAVNLAQRIQSLAGAGQIMVSEDTFRSAAGLVLGTVQPPTRVKGRNRPVIFYEVTGLK